jgi:chromosome partitioning protein
MDRDDEMAAAHRPEPTPIQNLPLSTKADTGNGVVLALTNQKGGVGKTTTAVNLGACLAEAGARVLLVDLDPQGNATTGVGIDRSTVKAGTYEMLGGTGGAEAILATDVAGLDVLPSTIDLAGAEVELVSAFARETKLRQGLASLRGEYDFVLIDSPPSLGLLTVNALAACDEVVVPIQCEYYALEGLGQLIRTLDLVRDGLNPSLRVGGVVLTMFDARTKLAEQVVAEVRRHFGAAVFHSIIPRSVRLSEAPGFGKPIIRYDPSSRAATAYRELAAEARARWPVARALEQSTTEGEST